MAGGHESSFTSAHGSLVETHTHSRFLKTGPRKQFCFIDTCSLGAASFLMHGVGEDQPLSILKVDSFFHPWFFSDNTNSILYWTTCLAARLFEQNGEYT